MNFKKSQNINSLETWFWNAKWKTSAFDRNVKPVKDVGFFERAYYGMVDDKNYSIIPKENHLVAIAGGDPLTAPRVFDFVADAWANMRLNFTVACQKNLIIKENSAFGDLEVVQAYENPKLKYTKYIKSILDFYNTNYIPQIVGINNITNHEQYVNYFFEMVKHNSINKPTSMSRWLKSYGASILDTGLVIKYANIPIDNDQRKFDEIINHASFDYFSNLCLNMGFSMLQTSPNILVFDVSSPAVRPYLSRKNIILLETLFERRYDRTYIYDMNILYSNINLYYNRYAIKYASTSRPIVVCKRSKNVWDYRSTVDPNYRPSADIMLRQYINLRNIEEGNPYSQQYLEELHKKAKYYQNKFDIMRAMGYISYEFKDQMWNKEYGFHDAITQSNAQQNTNQISPSSGPPNTSGGSTGGSGY